jgi:single-stranded DNA-binding protein
MSITITGKLNKAANQFQAGESTGFGLRLGVQYYDRKTNAKEWTNYSCVIFAKNANQIQFLQGALTEGAIVEVTAKQAKIEEYNGNHSIDLIDASLGYIGTTGQVQAAPAQQYQQPAPQPAYTGQSQPAPVYNNQQAPQAQQPQNQMPQDAITF